jgi:phage baseplate assembly protein gpV
MTDLLTSPVLTLELDGSPLAAAALRALRTLTVRQRRNRPSIAELVFEPSDGVPPLVVLAEARARLTLHAGDAVAPTFVGEVVAVDEVYGGHGLAELRVTALDRLHRLRLRQPLRAHVGLDCAALAELLVADLDLAVHALDRGPVTPRRVQSRQTDLELLEEACDAAGIGFFLETDQLHLFGAAGDPRVEIERRIGQSVLACTLTHDASAPPCANVEARGFEPDGRQVVLGAFYSDDLADEVTAEFDGVWRLCGERLAETEQATARATAIHERHAARRSAVTATVDGDRALRPGARLRISDAGSDPRLFTLTEVVHRFDAEVGYVCEVSSHLALPAAHHAPLPTWTFGDVIAIDDPDGRGRVRVKLGAFDDLETDWLAVTLPGGGPNKGLCALSDVGDRVLIVFQGGDLAHGVVLGGVFAGERPPEPHAAQAAVRSFTLRTARGQMVQLDEDGDRVRIEDRGGSHVELGPERVILHSNVDLEIRAPGKSMVLSADRIDFERS